MSYLSAEKRAEFRPFRKAADSYIGKIVENPVEINENLAVIRIWSPGAFVVNNVRMHDNIPYKCVQNHDSTGNETWNPTDTPALWMQYHGTSLKTARPWIAPTGAHDMYLIGEFMIWTDGSIKECLQDTIYDPVTYPQAWKTHTPTE